MDDSAFISAGKTPRDLFPWQAGEDYNAAYHFDAGHIFHVCLAGLHIADAAGEGLGGYVVMSDDDDELRRHLPAVRAAKGRVLKTGLGLGCFVRMCLLKPEVEHIDVVEIDKSIIDHFGAQFANNPRVTIHHADAFEFPPANGPWDLAWHDIYCEGNEGLQVLHAKLICRFADAAKVQGAWGFPDELAMISKYPILQTGHLTETPRFAHA